MKNMTLAVKILLGFGILIVITCLLGGVGVMNMRSVEKTATSLAREKVPAVALATNIERNALTTMYGTRGYALSEETPYLDQARKSLDEVKRYLKEAKAHGSGSASLVQVKEAAERAEAATTEYETLLNETVKLTTELEQERKSAEDSGKKYMDLCYQLIKIQETQFNTEIDAGADASTLKNRAANLTIVNDVIDLGNWIIIGTWKSQFRRDPNLFAETEKLFDKVNAKLDELKGRTKDEQRLKLIEECRTASKAYRKNMEVFLSGWLAREEVGKKRAGAAERVLTEAKKTAELGMTETAQASDNAASELSAASKILISGLGLAAILGIASALLITRSITKPVNRLVDGLTDASEQVASASGQISSSSQHLAEGASEQAASLEETSSSLEEMASMTRQNAENAQMARTQMAEAQGIIHRVSGHMDEMARAVQEITTSSEETGKIIKSIDEIAFQTNLLALNAAVEAARAGEAGAGFAVVADEVRNLALRAAEAAKNTNDLIESTIKAVRNGSDLTRLTQDAFRENMEISEKIAQLVDEIATASQEQSNGIGQVNTAVSDMDKVTQNVAANAEESASAAEEMNAQAEQLRAFVTDLKKIVGGKGAGSGRRNAGRSKAPRAERYASSGKTRVIVSPASAPPKNINGKAMPVAGAGRELRPEQLIPFDEDGMGDF